MSHFKFGYRIKNFVWMTATVAQLGVNDQNGQIYIRNSTVGSGTIAHASLKLAVFARGFHAYRRPAPSDAALQ